MDIQYLESLIVLLDEKGSEDANQKLTQIFVDEIHFDLISFIFSSECSAKLKYYALIGFKNVVKRYWNDYEPEKQQEMINFIQELIKDMNEQDSPIHFIYTADEVLVGIIKHIWPAQWATFIPDLINSLDNHASFKNALIITSMIAEEIKIINNEYCAGKVQRMRIQFEEDFHYLIKLVDNCLLSEDSKLVHEAIHAISKYSSIISSSIYNDTDILSRIFNTYLNDPEYCLDCVQVILAVNSNFQINMFEVVIQPLMQIIPYDCDFSKIDPALVHDFLEFLKISLIKHYHVMGDAQFNDYLQCIMTWIFKIAESVDSERIECLEIWNYLVRNVFHDLSKMCTYRSTFSYLIRYIQKNISNFREKETLLNEYDFEITTFRGDNIESGIMREILIFLSSIDQEFFISNFLDNLPNIEQEYAMNVCWAAAAVSGIFGPQEFEFFDQIEKWIVQFNIGIYPLIVLYSHYPSVLQDHPELLEDVFEKILLTLMSGDTFAEDIAMDALNEISITHFQSIDINRLIQVNSKLVEVLSKSGIDSLYEIYGWLISNQPEEKQLMLALSFMSVFEQYIQEGFNNDDLLLLFLRCEVRISSYTSKNLIHHFCSIFPTLKELYFNANCESNFGLFVRAIILQIFSQYFTKDAISSTPLVETIFTSILPDYANNLYTHEIFPLLRRIVTTDHDIIETNFGQIIQLTINPTFILISAEPSNHECMQVEMFCFISEIISSMPDFFHQLPPHIYDNFIENILQMSISDFITVQQCALQCLSEITSTANNVNSNYYERYYEKYVTTIFQLMVHGFGSSIFHLMINARRLFSYSNCIYHIDELAKQGCIIFNTKSQEEMKNVLLIFYQNATQSYTAFSQVFRQFMIEMKYFSESEINNADCEKQELENGICTASKLKDAEELKILNDAIAAL